MLSLITPVIKGYGTDKGYEVANNMQQVFGGHGYIEEWGMRQFVRDSRIAMIYEGTNGTPAMDLCGRQLGMKGRTIDRKCGDEGQRVAVRVSHGGHRTIKKKHH